MVDVGQPSLHCRAVSVNQNIIMLFERDFCLLFFFKKMNRWEHYVLRAGFAKPVGTDSVRLVPGGTGPARYTNRSGSHPKTESINSQTR
jgi:hypothetical protein